MQTGFPVTDVDYIVFTAEVEFFVAIFAFGPVHSLA